MSLVDLVEACSDVATVILPNLGKKAIMNLAASTPMIYRIVKDFVFQQIAKGDARWGATNWMLEYIQTHCHLHLQIGNIKLRPSQWYIKERISRMGVGKYFIRAPMSYGKTLLGLALASSGNERYVICVPPKALQTWLAEIYKMYGPQAILKNNPAQSYVLVMYAQSHKEHAHFISQNQLTAYNKIILTTTFVIRYLMGDPWVIGSRLILDEAATGKLDVSQIPWTCRLSANYIVDKYDHQISVKDSYMDRLLPNAKPMYWRIPASSEKERNQYAVLKDHYSLIEKMSYHYSDVLANILRSPSNGNKMVIYIPAGTPLEFMRPIVSFVANSLGMTCYDFDKKLDVLESFYTDPSRSVLVTSHNNSEAVNIHADSICVIRPDWLGFKRVKQLVGRVLRTGNPHREIAVHYVTAEGIGFFRTVYGEALRVSNIELEEIDPPPPREVSIQCALLKHAGFNFWEIYPIDLMMVLLPHEKSIYQKWKSSPHLLPESLAQTLHEYRL